MSTTTELACTPDGARAIIDAAREHAEPATIDPTKIATNVFVVPSGATLKTVEFDERSLDRPLRVTGTTEVEDVASLLAYVNQYYGAKTTSAWVDMANHRTIAILNDAHGDLDQEDGTLPAWRDHRVKLQLAYTAEWQRWRSLDGKLMGQEEFARHIEMRELDIVNPDAATLLEIAQHFYATTKSDFRSGTRLASGEIEFHHVEETTATAGRSGDLSIPAKFELVVAPFQGEDKVAVTVLLRYRVREGKLAIGYELVRPDDIERDVMQLIAETIRGDVARVYLGRP